MKNQKGISLITLIVTIIVIIILAAIFINYSFNNTLDSASFTRRVSEMSEVYDAIVQRGIEHKLDEDLYPYVGTKLTDAEPQVVNGVTYGDGYYYIETKQQKTDLKLERVVNNYIANYETGEVVSTIKIEYEGKDYYTLADVAGAVQPGSTTTPVGEYDEEQGVNKPTLSDGMVPVKQSGGDWVVTSEDDSSWYDYANGKYANMMLMDELTLDTTSNDELRNMTRDELNALSGTVVVPGSTFVWIPRYTYKEQGGNISIMYSHLTEDYTENGYIKSPAFYFGAYNGADTDLEPNSGYVGGGKELTGIWVSKYEAGYNQ
ncbi:hypothetical protein IJ556_04585 [bacterium]|nr:hypothetical protein [bacterium]